MKNRIIKIIFAVLITVVPLLTIAQAPPSRPNGGLNPDPGSGNTPLGGGAPIDGGLSILIALGAGYGAKKAYRLKK